MSDRYIGVGTAWAIPRPPRPTFDDVIDIYWSVKYESGARWRIGHRVWVHLLHLKDGNGRYQFPDFVLSVCELMLMGLPVDLSDSDQDALYIVLPDGDATTGATERLHALCRSCDTELPPAAAYCIKCGRAVAQER